MKICLSLMLEENDAPQSVTFKRADGGTVTLDPEHGAAVLPVEAFPLSNLDPEPAAS